MERVAIKSQSKGFIFDPNRCVGCQACVLACQFENKTELPYNWRSVYKSNSFTQSQIPLFYLSLACNHCEFAPCMKGCPTNAYSRDLQTDAVLIDSRKCMGCSYCSWLCPYDAPKMQNGLMQKCHYCEHRLKEDQKPACALNCPVGALDYREIELQDHKQIPFFIETGIKPKIEIKALNENRKKPEMDMHAVSNTLEIDIPEAEIKEKIQLKDEWPLALFSFITAVLVGYYFSCLAGNIPFYPIPFFVAALAGFGVSLLHLGKPGRAFHSILNFKHSWLSREIIFYILFFGIMAFGYFVDIRSVFLLVLSIVLGLLCLVSADLLYSKTGTSKKIFFHSGGTVFIALFVFLISFPDLLILVVLAKNLIYLIRKLFFVKKNDQKLMNLTVIKLFFAIVIPVIAYPSNMLIVIASLLISELLDRFEFYLELRIMTPEKRMKESNH
ncbi:MAG: 4Fe-4S binding protein [Bacteroidetes bacterium]|nr:4Fe-4S binding protein [Bacteroidota bacterium]MBL6963079.1 4Fe-4S binding protein [Bacteroidota bacterium]